MKLKSVELIGFKSFAKKTRINFPAGITEIVGPNGSGKSNIIEAIRWVLGEQSAKNLRSSRMTDVIFSGSQSYPALNRAKVALNFDNSDHFINTNYTDLRIARTVYRDGTNNYYLNGKPCRLRDIQDLFMNTGIGNGSFSIISQGKVAQIFKSKPVDRRFIIETVAGIYKYRSQKEIAANKLAHVDNDFTRVSDLNYELRQRLQNLDRERQVAQEYLAKKRVANHLDIKRLLIISKQVERKRHINQGHVNQLLKKLNQFKQHETSLKNSSDRFDHQVTRLMTRYDRTQEEILNSSRRLDAMSNQKSLSQQKVSFWRHRIKQAKLDLTKTKRLISNFKRKKSELINQRTDLSKQINSVHNNLMALGAKREPNLVGQFHHKIDQLRSNYVDLVKQLTKIRGQIQNQHHNHQENELRISHLKSQLTNVKQLVDKSHQQLVKTNDNLLRVKRQIAKDTDVINAQQDKSRQLIKQFKALRNKYHASYQKQQALQIRVTGLRKIKDQHSNLYNGTRNLLNHRDRFSGILGPVADFIEVSKPYIQAIETTLRSQLQQVIVDNAQTARDIVTFMSTNHLGRVTLLPVNAISKRWLRSSIINKCRQVPGFIDVAANLVQMPERFSVVKFHLLGNVLISKDISSAIQISQMIHHRYRVVTLDGNVVNAGGAITGGHGRYHYHGLLSQKAKMIEYQEMLNKLTGTIQEQKTLGIRLSKQLNQVHQQIDAKQKVLNQNQRRYAVQKNLKAHLSNEFHNYQGLLNQRQQLVDRPNNGNVSMRDLRQAQAKIKDELDKNHYQMVHIHKELSQQTSITQKYDQKYQSLRESLIKIRSQKEQLSHDLNTKSTQLSQATHNLNEHQNDIQRFTQAINNQGRQSTDEGNLMALSKQIDQLNNKKVHYHNLITGDKRSLTKLNSNLSHLQSQLLNLRNQLNQDRLTSQEVDRKAHEVNGILGRKYQIDVAKVKIPEFKLSLNQISSKLFNVQKHLQQIGPVNVGAIKQFQKINRRYQFLSKQINDLVTSKHQLMTTMNQMDSKIKVRFKDTFDKVNQAFKVTYSQIFKGGRAKLELIDPKHLLTTGVNIMAQPPGKRYRNMELLSGGERALTAIALLFAILKVKPAPFCILDEAESALDTVNIDRFGNYMQKLKAKTQFIVITHRKTTMLYADNLYGVTMQNSGVSKIISVNLKKAKTEG